ncbi:MAG: flagellar type III secretion system pore protein FliP [Pseudomonadota bacterium]
MQRRTSPIGGILSSRVSILAVWLLAGCIGLLCLSSSAWAQSPGPGAAPIDLASENLVPQTDGEEATPLTARVVQTFIVITVLSLAPGIAMMITCLPFMVVVLSILRQAIGLQAAPPNMMIISLAIFLTFFVMEPIFKDAWSLGVTPYLEDVITEDQAIDRTLKPFRAFMEGRVAPGVVAALADAAPQEVLPGPDDSVPYKLLVPAFMLSEIQHAFEVGFLVFLPFVLIDLIVASILMAMGMMMVPPAVISLPFKLIFFVLSDGWTVVAAALVRGYAT